MINAVVFARRWKKVYFLLYFLLFSSVSYSGQGPGLGQLQYSQNEVFTQISQLVDNNEYEFLPQDYPGRLRYGTNGVTMRRC